MLAMSLINFCGLASLAVRVNGSVALVSLQTIHGGAGVSKKFMSGRSGGDGPDGVWQRSLREDSRSSSAAQKARQYQERKQGGTRGDAGSSASHITVPPALLDDVPDVYRFTSAMESIVDKAITASMERGEFTKLKGHGQPLPHRHEDQFATVDPLMAAMTRALGAQGLRPESLELRDELRSALLDFGTHVRDASSTATRSGLGRHAAWLAAAKAGTDPGVAHRFSELKVLWKRYNDATLKDRELMGQGWPLQPHPRLMLEDLVTEGLEEQL